MPLRAEFIGRQAKIKGTTIEGMIIDESKNSFVIQTSKGKKTILKSNNIFEINNNKETITIEGKQIQQRPEDRIKLKPWK